MSISESISKVVLYYVFKQNNKINLFASVFDL